jgi:predicted DCC family thiol-disulfide oxidoreductase YuxK
VTVLNGFRGAGTATRRSGMAIGHEPARFATQPQTAVFFYDAECGMCDRTVQVLLKYTRPEVLSFCPLQSALAARLLDACGSDQPSLRVARLLLPGGRHCSGSSAILKAMALSRTPLALCGLLLFVPKPLREIAYQVVATHRRRGARWKSCGIRDSKARARFLE